MVSSSSHTTLDQRSLHSKCVTTNRRTERISSVVTVSYSVEYAELEDFVDVLAEPNWMGRRCRVTGRPSMAADRFCLAEADIDEMRSSECFCIAQPFEVSRSFSAFRAASCKGDKFLHAFSRCLCTLLSISDVITSTISRRIHTASRGEGEDVNLEQCFNDGNNAGAKEYRISNMSHASRIYLGEKAILLFEVEEDGGVLLK
mmetsp:Transcript_24570/g.62195  ORF Transcript_24570/g.62195 Transcript_24570/m.62195 type:complete len:202 (+) Transcript_24570:566-1171(+)